MPSKLSRRQFIALAGAGTLGASLAACATRDNATPGATPTPTVATADELDAAIEKAIRYFVVNMETHAKTFFPPRPTPRIEGDTRVFELTCQEILAEVRWQEKLPVFTFGETIPAPEIRVTEGDKVRVVVQNNLKESTTIHFHGVFTSNVMDGATYISQPPLRPGQRFAYEFIAQPVGSFLYRAHHNASEQIARGLVGSLVVEPKDKKSEPAFDRDFTLILNDARAGLTLNGRVFPMTAPILTKPGERIRIRWMNAGYRAHTLHLHGHAMHIIAANGSPIANSYSTDVLDLAPGSRVDTLVVAGQVGTWVVDCAPNEITRGATTMVTALVVR